tara:strand:- start:255 stop:845 length:591 start_codon:yes stop_codon:yes gene_type:complete
MSKTKKKLTYEEQEKLLDELSMKGSEEHKKYIDDETGEVRFRKTDNDYRLSVDNPECDIDKLNNDHLLRRKSQFCYLPGTNYYFLSYKYNCTGSDKNLHHVKWVRSMWCTYQTVQNFMYHYSQVEHMDEIQNIEIFDEDTLNEVCKFKKPDGTFTEEMTLREYKFGGVYQKIYEGIVSGKDDKIGEYSSLIENCNR